MNTKPRTLFILIGLFLAGAASGAFLALRLAHSGHDRSPEQRPFMERNCERMDRAIDFTSEQRPQVEALMRTTGDELAKLRRESRETTVQQIRSMNAKIEAMLTPGQRVKFEAFQKEQFERMRRHQLERDHRGHPRSGDAPPPEDMREPPAPSR